MSDKSELEKTAEEYAKRTTIFYDEYSCNVRAFKAGAEWQSKQVWNVNNPLKRCDELLTCAEKERDQLKAEVEHLQEIISYLPKVPTEPYEKMLAQRCEQYRAQCEQLAAALEFYQKRVSDVPCDGFEFHVIEKSAYDKLLAEQDHLKATAHNFETSYELMRVEQARLTEERDEARAKLDHLENNSIPLGSYNLSIPSDEWYDTNNLLDLAVAALEKYKDVAVWISVPTNYGQDTRTSESFVAKGALKKIKKARGE